jgi:signal transduction histidine kinase
VSFVLVAGLSAGALAVSSFLLVRQARLSGSLDRAQAEATFGLILTGRDFEPLDQTNIDGLINGFGSSKRDVVLYVGDERTSTTAVDDLEVPASLRAVVQSGDLGFQRLTFRGRSTLLVGGRIPGSTDELYFVTDEDRLRRDLDQIRNVLLVGWVTVVVVAALVGGVLARRTLGPVAKASRAARAMAGGRLETRLPVEGTDEFAAWAASFNEMADALESKIAALSEAQARERRFTSDVAHELRTPVTALLGEASLLRDHLDRLPEEARRPAELLIADVARLRRLVEELMEVSRFDAGRETVQAEGLDLASVVRALIRQRGWDDRVEVQDAASVELSSDRRRLDRIVGNLVGNALEHGGSGVRVRVGREGRQASVEVSDQGPGIAPEHVAHLFERFYKGDPSRAGGGSGLGLAIARENARLLGGDIEVQSEVGVGTTFRLSLPVPEPLHGGEPAVAPAADHGGRP